MDASGDTRPSWSADTQITSIPLLNNMMIPNFPIQSDPMITGSSPEVLHFYAEWNSDLTQVVCMNPPSDLPITDADTLYLTVVGNTDSTQPPPATDTSAIDTLQYCVNSEEGYNNTQEVVEPSDLQRERDELDELFEFATSQLDREFEANTLTIDTTAQSCDTSHERESNGDKRFTCDICQKTFLRSHNYYTHIRTHIQGTSFSCKICDRKFARKCTLNIHLRTHTGEKTYCCDVCDRKFALPHHLSDHMRTHTGEKPYSCHICQRRYLTKSNLTGHLLTHTGQKRFSCNICGRKFSQRNHLLAHIKTHTGEKPHSCHICSKKFITKSHLNAHVKVHTEDKLFECDICKRKCTQRSNLVIHMRTHTGERPFSCDVCPRKFITKSNLNAHTKTHTSESKKKLHCAVCHRRFARKRNLKRHILKSKCHKKSTQKVEKQKRSKKMTPSSGA